MTELFAAVSQNFCMKHVMLCISYYRTLELYRLWSFKFIILYTSNFWNYAMIILCRVHCNPVQGENRVFPVKFSTQGKTCFNYREPLFSLQGPLFSLQGFPCEKTSRGMGLQCMSFLISLVFNVFQLLLKYYLCKDIPNVCQLTEFEEK